MRWSIHCAAVYLFCGRLSILRWSIDFAVYIFYGSLYTLLRVAYFAAPYFAAHLFCGAPILRCTYFAVHLFCGAPISRRPYFAVHLFRGVPISRCTYFAVHLFCGAPILRCTYFAAPLFRGPPILRCLTIWRYTYLALYLPRGALNTNGPPILRPCGILISRSTNSAVVAAYLYRGLPISWPLILRLLDQVHPNLTLFTS